MLFNVLLRDYWLDVDEYENGSANCSVDATCTNAVPGFNCTCNPGYQGDGFSCEGNQFQFLVYSFLHYTSNKCCLPAVKINKIMLKLHNFGVI